ncbi:MAG: D-alanine--D-alanine ligase [Aquificaceae bacterium]|nr:D-alanine--D-alanine ligase [Aquificaceae bacterium]MDW8237167.1 D-alanine--D-alanine ligase [Aquificaceae bacterium]
MRVIVIAGGDSPEREISLKSASSVLRALANLGHEAYLLEPSSNICNDLASLSPELVFIAVHGSPGEDGRLQGLLDILGIPYVGSSVLGSAISMDKDVSKKLVSFHGVRVPRWICIKNPKDAHPDWDIYPCIVKPADLGSSVGLYLVKTKDALTDAIERCLKISKKVMVEEFIEGVDCTVAILLGKALTPILIKPSSEVYDYESKYTHGKSEYSFVEDSELAPKLKELAKVAHSALELGSFSRIDFRVSKEGEPYFLEANSIPGLTELSLFPMACAKDGIDLRTLIEILLRG